MGRCKGPKGAGMHPRRRRAAGPCWLDRTGANAPAPLALHHNGDTWRHNRGPSSSGRPLDVDRGHSSDGTTGPRPPSTWVPFEAGQPRRLAVSWCGPMVGRGHAGEGEPWQPRRIPALDPPPLSQDHLPPVSPPRQPVRSRAPPSALGPTGRRNGGGRQGACHRGGREPNVSGYPQPARLPRQRSCLCRLAISSLQLPDLPSEPPSREPRLPSQMKT